MGKNLVLTDSGVNLSKFITHLGAHTCEEGGVQALLEFPNGYGASIAYVPGEFGTVGVELQAFRYCGDWWELIGLPFVSVSPSVAKEVLLRIHEFQNWRLMNGGA